MEADEKRPSEARSSPAPTSPESRQPIPGSSDGQGQELPPSKNDLEQREGDGDQEPSTAPPSATPMTAQPAHAFAKQNIPLLHPPSQGHLQPDSSYVEPVSMDEDHHLDSMAEEQQVRAQLQDVEESFIPPISPIQVTGPEPGIDDTFVFDAVKTKTPSPAPSASTTRRDDQTQQAYTDPTSTLPTETGDSTTPIKKENGHEDSRSSTSHADTAPAANESDLHDSSQLPTSTTPRSPPNQTQPAAQPAISITGTTNSANDTFTAADDADTGNSTLALETMSSPAANAAARTASRTTSRAAEERQPTPQDDQDFSARDSSHLDIPRPDDSGAGGTVLLRQSTSEADQSKSTDNSIDSTGSASAQGSLRFGNRPRFLRSRNASQRSSTSSNLDNDNESDVTVGLGVDYAIQSGGSIPAYGMQRSMSNMLARSISMGSMASGIEDLEPVRGLEPLEPLDEVERPPSGEPPKSLSLLPGHSDDSFSTPKPKKKGPLLAPTDTVIARHVRNVEVPESLAREYKTQSGLETPKVSQHIRKVSDYTPAPGTVAKNGRNLTLKEQSSTIERLSKENFDLKLKVMFLSDRLDKLSESGVKEMISENVELKTSLAVIQRDNKVLRKKNKDLEKRWRDRDDEADRPSTARSGYSSDGRTTREREEELYYLRERVEEYVTEIEQLKSENMASQAEKRKLAEVVKAMGDKAGERVGDSLGRQEEADVYKDLLEQETARREQTDDDNRKLRDEIFRLKQEVNIANGGTATTPGGMHHTTNIYNITRKHRPQSPSRSRPVSGLSGDLDQTSSQATTLVDELRRETDQLRHENAELRREVGAQTSMLTSRNREKERLYQEIEDLKLASRRGGPAPSTIDTLLDRSASRAGAHERSQSRGSARTKLTMAMEDPEREDFENKLAEHRDKISEIKLQNQELQRELDTCMQDFETAVESKQQAEEVALSIQQELDNTLNDLMAIQAERDQALREQAEMEAEFESLRNEAQEEISALEGETDMKDQEIERLQEEVQDRQENFEALQEEMRKMSDAIVRLEDEQEKKHRRIEQLEAELGEANREGEELEAKLLESNEKANRLGVQQESSQGEIAFLREEQEADKIRIGDLEAAIAGAEQSLRDERERVKDLNQRLAKERQQHELVSSREKEEVQHFVNELNKELAASNDEVRRLRKNLHSREVEATEWKERLIELENNLREALGDLNGTRSSLLKSIGTLQRELENTVHELNSAKAAMLEKDRIIKQRDALLESHGLESRKLAEMLDKERQGHRNTKNAFDTFQRTHQHVSRTVNNQDGRILELETARANDKKKIALLETSFRDQLTERNNLLLVLWTRLSSLCGSDWAHNNSLINGRALPSLEAVSTMLPGFSKNLLAAVKMIESLTGSFQSRIKSVQNDLWKEYQSLENNLDHRIKKLDRLETIVRNGIVNGDFNSTARISQLEAAYRAVKIENATLQRANDAKTRAVSGYFDQPTNGRRGSVDDDAGSPSPYIPTGPIRKSSGIPRSKTTPQLDSSASSSKSRNSTMTRTASNNLAPPDFEQQRTGTSNGEMASTPGGTNRASSGSPQPQDNKWMFRLRELEHKLKQEREARNLDRAAARQRIAEGERQKDELVAELIKVRRKGGE
ncbi:Anucleate primary sterigmata protein B [Apiospora phragmitis]|uniref:Anucleate primary sterigmata protein B n=1 Tax=Apiospora phragmitis TaxID=2905665 RepID=A0ABR1TBB3_9PEZI